MQKMPSDVPTPEHAPIARTWLSLNCGFELFFRIFLLFVFVWPRALGNAIQFFHLSFGPLLAHCFDNNNNSCSWPFVGSQSFWHTSNQSIQFSLCAVELGRPRIYVFRQFENGTKCVCSLSPRLPVLICNTFGHCFPIKKSIADHRRCVTMIIIAPKWPLFHRNSVCASNINNGENHQTRIHTKDCIRWARTIVAGEAARIIPTSHFSFILFGFSISFVCASLRLCAVRSAVSAVMHTPVVSVRFHIYCSILKWIIRLFWGRIKVNSISMSHCDWAISFSSVRFNQIDHRIGASPRLRVAHILGGSIMSILITNWLASIIPGTNDRRVPSSFLNKWKLISNLIYCDETRSSDGVTLVDRWKLAVSRKKEEIKRNMPSHAQFQWTP